MFYNYLIFGSSANITLTAGIVLGVLYGGKTAIAVNPGGTRLRAVARVWVLGASAPTAVGGAPPPASPGATLPVINHVKIRQYYTLIGDWATV